MNSNSTITYRADIDGLRAFAVLAVLGSHFFPNIISGGFVGVDIFFVISGYLITHNILKGVCDPNGFNLGDFYCRRILRIFPSLLVVLFLSGILGWFILPPEDLLNLRKHIAGAAGFITNIILWREAGYFDTETEFKPMMHLWSLSVEEQFYLLWPLLILVGARTRKYLGAILTVIFLTSFGLSIWLLHNSMVTAFFFTGGRLWELAAGGLLSYYQVSGQESKVERGGTLVDRLSSAGIFLIILAIFIINEKTFFPGWWPLLPVAGAVAIILAGPHAWLNRYFLSHPVVVFIGLISYPLYLWHWPLLSFARIHEHTSHLPLKYLLPILCFSFILASLTYFFIEKPIRQAKRKALVTALLCLLMFIIAMISISNFKKRGYQEQISANLKAKTASWMNSCRDFTGTEFSDDYCNRGTAFKDPTVIIIGDSFSGFFSVMLGSIAKELGLKFTQIGRGQCPMLLNYGPEKCFDIADKAMDFIESVPTIHTVIIAADWSQYTNGKMWGVNESESSEKFLLTLDSTISYLERIGKKVVLFFGTPKGHMLISCTPTADRNRCYEVKRDAVTTEEINYREALKRILLQHPNVQIFDPIKNLCGENTCPIEVNGNLIYFDTRGHLTDFGSAYLGSLARNELLRLLQ